MLKKILSDWSAPNDLSCSSCARGGACSCEAFAPSFGAFRCVKTRITPGARSASRVSIAVILPFATVPSTMKPYATFGTWNSAAYFALPVTFATPSTRLIGFPRYLGITFLRATRARRSRQPARAHERADDGPLPQLHLVGVVREGPRVRERRLSGPPEAPLRCGLPREGGL